MRKRFDNSFGLHLRSLRQAKDLSVQELSEKIGKSHTVIQLYEKGSRLPSHETILLYANAFDVSPTSLYEERYVCIERTIETYGTVPSYLLTEYYAVRFLSGRDG